MFSPILPTSALRASSTVAPFSGKRGQRRRHRPGCCAATSSASAPGEGEEIVVLGHEIGLAVDFDHRADLAVVRNVGRDHAFGRDAGGRLARLVAELDAQDLLGLAQVAAGFGQRLLAFHHRRIGLLAQFLDHACGDFRHSILAP